MMIIIITIIIIMIMSMSRTPEVEWRHVRLEAHAKGEHGSPESLPSDLTAVPQFRV